MQTGRVQICLEVCGTLVSSVLGIFGICIFTDEKLCRSAKIVLTICVKSTVQSNQQITTATLCQSSQISLLQLFFSVHAQTVKPVYKIATGKYRHKADMVVQDIFRAVLSKSHGHYIDCLNDSLSVVLIHKIN